MKTAEAHRVSPGVWFFCGLTAILAILFWESFVPGQILFSNDGPLSVQKADWCQLPSGFTGIWDDMNYLGLSGVTFPPDLTALIRMALGAVGYAKFLAPVALAIAGLSAWFFFRRLGFTVAACTLGGLTVALNSDFFSTACWGVASQVIAFGMNFIAMGLVVGNKPNDGWRIQSARFGLAGLAVGMGVMEGADNGALFSMLTAAFVVFYSLLETGPIGIRLARGVGQTALIAAFAGFIAASTVSSLVSTQIEGVVGTQQDAQSKAANWSWATYWSMPKLETLGLAVPGLFGYRIYGATQETQYWGGVGRDPQLDKYFEKGEPPPQGASLHFIGSGIYAGVPVLLVVVWTVLQAARRNTSVFSPKQRALLGFWIVVALVSLLFSFGRFAQFYQFFYALPYASAIRNPTKFLHVMTFALLVIFGYGVDALCQRYLAAGATSANRFASGWAKAGVFEKRWIIGCGVALALGLVAWRVYVSSSGRLEQYLQTFAGFDSGSASVMAAFSIEQVGWTVLFLALSAGLMASILMGVFGGGRARFGGVLLGLLLVADLGRANQPWLYYWDIGEKYTTNPIIDILRDKPYEHRVALLPLPLPPEFHQLYHREWKEQHYVYYNIQTLDVVQLSRQGSDLAAFDSALSVDGNTLYRLVRRWQLTNTRYLVGPSASLPSLNQQLDPVQKRFRIAAAFDVAPKPGVTRPTRMEQLTAVLNPNGALALIEFTGALPRAKLYTHWQVNTNDEQTLATLGSASFDPADYVLVANPLPTADPAAAAKQNSATVEYSSYSPKRIVLQSRAEAPTVLLLNDRFDPGWTVSVDGKPETLLRCNFIMRGVHLPAGAHTIVFQYEVPHPLLNVSLAAIGVGIVLLATLLVAGRGADGDVNAPLS